MLLHYKISHSFSIRSTICCLVIAMLTLSSCSPSNPASSIATSSAITNSTISSEPSSLSDTSTVSSVVSTATSSVASSVTSMPGDPKKEVKDYLAALSKSDLANGKKALSFVVSKASSAKSDEEKDTILGLYLDYSYQLLFSLMDTQFSKLNTLRNSGKAAFNVLIAQSGLRTIEVDGSFVLVPDFTVLLTAMNSILSANGKQYCGLMASLHNLEPIASEAGVLIPLADLNKLKSEWAAFNAKITPSTIEFPPSTSKYKGHFEARLILARLNSLSGTT